MSQTIVSLDDFKNKDVEHKVPFVEKKESNNVKTSIQTEQENLEHVVQEVKKDITCVGHVIMSIARCVRRTWSCSLNSCECCCTSLSNCCIGMSDCAKGCNKCLESIDCDEK